MFAVLRFGGFLHLVSAGAGPPGDRDAGDRDVHPGDDAQSAFRVLLGGCGGPGPRSRRHAGASWDGDRVAGTGTCQLAYLSPHGGLID